MFNYIDPSFSIFGLEITWYAVCILIGVILAVVFGITEGKKLGICSDDIYTGVVFILPCSIIGARLWYILFNLDQGWTFRKIIGLEGGLAGLGIQGAIIVAFLLVFIYCKYIKKISLYRIMDLVAPGFFIGQICGRWGNFFNRELYGPVIENVELFQKLLPNFITENMKIAGKYHHPTFLYESLLNLIGLAIMVVLRRKSKKLESGDLVGLYLTWYGMVRIFTESLRSLSGANEILMLGPIPVSIALSVIFILCGIAFLITKRFVGPRKRYLDVLKEVEENRFDTVLFDLDGTLLDSKNLVFKSFIHTFEHFRPGYVLKDEELESFFGPTLQTTFSKYAKDEKEVQEMIEYYREFNKANHDEMVSLFPGVKEIITTLHKKKYKLGIISSKKDDLVNHALELFNIKDKFDIIIGADMVKKHKPDPEGILLAIKKLESKNACFVGDTQNDILAATNAGIKSVAAMYSADPEKMIEVNPDYLIYKFQDLLRVCVE
jgi:phosphatidylglycerol:prolipoprotein diacylglycerol transferase